MPKANTKKTERVTYVQTVYVTCRICREQMLIKPGKKPAKILAVHLKRRHGQ